MLLYGITTLQTYLYYVYYPSDRRDTRILVAVIWILDTLHISFMCHSMYYYLVSNFGNVAALAVGTWSLYASLAVNLCIAVLVQMFFSVRIFYLCRPEIRWIVSVPIVLMVVAHFGFGIETVVFMFMKEQFKSLSQITYYAATPFAVTAVLSDIFIAVALCILLYGKRSPFFQTNVLVDTLIVYAINRCLLTSLVAIIEVIVFAILPHSLWFLGIDFVIGKLYANSFLASLNSRGSLRDRDLQRNDVESSMRINSPRTTEWRVAGDINNSRTSRDKYKHRSTTGTVATSL